MNRLVPIDSTEAGGLTATHLGTKRKRRVVWLVIAVAILVVFSLGFGSGVAFVHVVNLSQSVTTSAKGNTDAAGSAQRPTATESSDRCVDVMNDIRPGIRVLAINYIEYVCEFYYRQNFTNMFDMYEDTTISEQGDRRMSLSNRRPPERGRKATRARTMTGMLEESAYPPLSSSGTNNRHTGVQEVDIVQCNGTHVFVVYGNDIVVINVTAMTISSRTSVPQADPYPPGLLDSVDILLLDKENRLIVIKRQYVLDEMTAETSDALSSYDTLNTTLFIYDATTMTMLEKVVIPGSYIGARAIGTKVHVVTETEFEIFWSEKALQPAFIGSLTTEPMNEDTYRAKALAELELQLELFLERLALRLDCERLTRLSWTPFANNSSPFLTSGTMATVSSFDASLPVSLNSTSILVPMNNYQVFASPERLVLLCDVIGWSSWREPTNEPELLTYLAVLSFQGASTVAPSLGLVPGYVNTRLIDHYHMEGKDFLRILSASYFELDDFSLDMEHSKKSPPLTMRTIELTEGGEMLVVGQLAGLGKPLDVAFSVLFQSERALLASANSTKNNKNSFYVLNMSNPVTPFIQGELELEGYATCLLDIGQNLVLSIGANGAPQILRASFASFGSFQLSLLDVSNFGRPRFIQTWEDEPPSVADNTETFTTVEYDQKTFRYLPDQQILIVPMKVATFKRGLCSDLTPNADELTPSYSMIQDESGCYVKWRVGDSSRSFRLFKINVTGIFPLFSIEPQTPGYGLVYDILGLLPRSLVVESNVVTLQGNLVMSHNLATQSEAGSVILEQSNYSTDDDLLY